MARSTEARERWKLRLPVECSRCSQLVQPWDDWHLDHTVPLAMGGSWADTWPAHAVCNMTGGVVPRPGDVPRVAADGTDLTRFLSGPHTPLGLPAEGSLPGTAGTGGDGAETAPTPSDGVWDAAVWIDRLRDVPSDATWPRYMSAPHPRAAGSYGDEYAEWVAGRLGDTLRWWQYLVAARVPSRRAALRRRRAAARARCRRRSPAR